MTTATARTEFNYEAAYDKLALPAWEALPAHFKALVARVEAEAADILQDRRTLDLPWPASDLRAQMEAAAKADPMGFALAARTTYFVGHWQYRAVPHVFGAGVGWRYANYADQVLTALLGLPRDRCGGNRDGITYAVHEGFLRVQYRGAGPNGDWTWEEVGPATPELLAAIRQTTGMPTPHPRPSRAAKWEAVKAYFARVQKIAESHLRPEAVAWLTASKTYVAEHGWYGKRREAERAADQAFREAVAPCCD